MMRKPNIASASSDLAFALIALVIGWLGGAPLYAGLAIFAAVAVWGWTRRTALAAMPLQRRAANSAIAIGMIVVVLAIAYWIGLALGGHT